MDSTFKFDSQFALRQQAKLRLVMVCVLTGLWLSIGTALGWQTYERATLASLHLLYAAVTYYTLQHKSKAPSDRALTVTAFFDAAFLFGWILVTGPYGILFTPLFNFASIGYGMRTGKRAILRISNGVSLAFACAVPVVSPYWADHIVVWGSVVLGMIIVPWYAGQLTRQFRAAIQFAEKQTSAKSELLARVSHELRTPLGGISNAAELLAAEVSTDRERMLTGTILKLSEHLLGDINDLIDQSRLTFGKMELDTGPQLLDEQIEVVRASLESHAKIKGLYFHAIVDPRIVGPVIADGRWLSRVLINLAGNAVKFTDVGGVTINVMLMSETAEEYLVRFRVQDTGIGIPANRQADIFKPFVQVKIPGAASREGSGLGLAISQQAVELMGGTLRVSSSVDGGSQFWFDLPMKKAERSVAPRQTSQRPTQAPADHAELPAPTTNAPRTTGVLRILLVDDNSTNLFLLKELLQQDGHVVVTASSGEVALGILSDHDDFDMLILDYNLGTMTGAEVLQIYRMGRSNPVPAWFLTADATRITAEKLNATGALGVLTKPVRIESLRGAVLAAAAQVRRDAHSDTDRQGVMPTARTEAASAPPGRLRAVSVVYIDATAIGRLRAVGQTADFLVGMLGRAADDIAHSADRLGLAWHKGSLEDVRDAAHALKSVASETGAIRLANIAAAIMRADDDVLDSDKNRLLGDLRDTVDRTVAAMQEIIQRENKAASSF